MSRKSRKILKRKKHNRKQALLKGAAATGAVFGGTAMFGQGNQVYAAEATGISESESDSESVLEQPSASESKIHYT